MFGGPLKNIISKMSAQTQRGTNTRRRAMSADHALTRAQERMNSKIDAAVNAGITGQLQKSMNVTLKLGGEAFPRTGKRYCIQRLVDG